MNSTVLCCEMVRKVKKGQKRVRLDGWKSDWRETNQRDNSRLRMERVERAMESAVR